MLHSFDLSMDELGTDNWFKLDIDNLTLANTVKAMTHGSLPSPLNSPTFSIGFKKYVVC